MVLQCYTWILNLFQQMFGGDVLRNIECIPNDIILNILSRLPAESVFQCQKVCKNWLMLISSYEFIEMQQRMTPPAMIRCSYRYPCNFYIIDGNSERKCWANSLGKDVEFVSCCNGLVLLRAIVDKLKYFVLNPLLPARITIIDDVSCWYGKFCGFFFHPLVKEYRILFLRPYKTSYNYHVYLFGSKKWRRTARPSFRGEPFGSKVKPAIVKGALHWCGKIKLNKVIDEYRYEILIFDVVSEEFSTRPFPKYFFRGRWTIIDLLVKEDQLCMCTRGRGDMAMFVWTLEDYAKWHWIKQYKVNLDWDVQKYPMEIVGLEALTGQIDVLSIHNGELRLFWRYRGVFFCQMDGNMVKKIHVKKLHHSYYTDSYMSYTKSLARLPDWPIASLFD